MQTTVVTILVLGVVLMCLRLSFLRSRWIGVASLVVGVVVGLSWPWAIEQSRTQIADMLGRPAFMLDVAVVLTLEVAMDMAYVFLSADRMAGGALGRWRRVALSVLEFVPGLTGVGSLLCLEVYLIFSLPGLSFGVVSWSLAAGVVVGLPLVSLALRRLLPEEDLRLEMVFLCSALVGLLGVVATVNGRTAVAGVDQTDWLALLGVVGLVVLVGAVGLARSLVRRRSLRLKGER